VREGIILCLTQETQQIGWGEIAPLPWFGSETLEEAEEFCQKLGNTVTEETIFSIPTVLPACQFGFESAWEALTAKIQEPPKKSLSQGGNLELSSFTPLKYSGLLPTGEPALKAWQDLWNQGYNTFKWKIGVTQIEEEFKLFHQLIAALPAEARLRLDANGGLDFSQATAWLQVCDQAGVEFLEQPLAVDQFDAMLQLSHRYVTPIALDESVATLQQLESCYQRGWQGIFVIKAAIAGSPKRLRQLCQTCKIDAVFSSVFESAIGRQAALKLAVELSQNQRAVGFGINHWFSKEDETWLEKLWKRP
jgi:O-succinylbenzoate synthase